MRQKLMNFLGIPIAKQPYNAYIDIIKSQGSYNYYYMEIKIKENYYYIAWK